MRSPPSGNGRSKEVEGRQLPLPVLLASSQCSQCQVLRSGNTSFQEPYALEPASRREHVLLVGYVRYGRIEMELGRVSGDAIGISGRGPKRCSRKPSLPRRLQARGGGHAFVTQRQRAHKPPANLTSPGHPGRLPCRLLSPSGSLSLPSLLHASALQARTRSACS